MEYVDKVWGYAKGVWSFYKGVFAMLTSMNLSKRLGLDGPVSGICALTLIALIVFFLFVDLFWLIGALLIIHAVSVYVLNWTPTTPDDDK